MNQVQIHSSWKDRLIDEINKSYFTDLVNFIRSEYQSKTIYPPGKLIFNAFDQCSFENTRVVIIGQDPYHGAGQANGLCFSVADGITKPPSLINIFKEIESDMGKAIPQSGNLERWARQGVLMLNATLTVEAGKAGSHQNKGWELFTDAVIDCINKEKNHVVFLLWGRFAQEKGKKIDAQRHLVLSCKHPSPMSANSGGWFGNKHFSKTNAYLRENKLEEINW